MLCKPNHGQKLPLLFYKISIIYKTIKLLFEEATLFLSKSFFFFCLFRAAPMVAYKVPRIGVELLQPQQHEIQPMSETYTTAHGNAGSPTH